MSYESVEAALRTQLATIANLNVVLNDATKIQGGSQKIVILKYGRFTQERFAMGGEHTITWQVEMNLLCRYTNDADTRNLLRDTRNAILTRINEYPLLEDPSEVYDALITSGETLPDAVTFGSFRYLGEVLTCEIAEKISVDYKG